MKAFAFLMSALCLCTVACTKEATKYKDLLNDAEIIYPGPVSSLNARPGHLRAMLQWQPSPDPSITEYIIYWNNNTDSMKLPAKGTTKDTIRTLITGMDEYVQNFVLYTTDGKGNKSVGQSLSGVRIYGPLYISSLVNRQLNSSKPPEALPGNAYKLFFSATDTALNTNTRLTFYNANNQLQTVDLPSRSDSVVLNAVNAGTKVAVLSSYIPELKALDTFHVAYSDTITVQ
ncbi:hypothetical protein HF324_06965 [Chitinophaga oryzae]|uniref:DUF4998 domain-containing protein n=1 Tax=Chitinophaga oryzae TaxID=2725414 RepID=A0AAE6ZED6_9BACT|nr:DUF4998 domain-containing protein [Chitinophaga oryzae]QJB31119.1 hypothetical protein HF329_07310 [Chitinophaga oryzae]QJB37604.1 hypothetical protein HF324_06965 [Chitinophaga oryzae]